MAKTVAHASEQVPTKSRCPSCGHVVESTLEAMKLKPQFPCPSCGGDCDVREAVAWVEIRIGHTWLKRVA